MLSLLFDGSGAILGYAPAESSWCRNPTGCSSAHGERFRIRKPDPAQKFQYCTLFPNQVSLRQVAIQLDCSPMLKALADPTRWRIVRELIHDTRTVGDLTERLTVTQYNVSKHLRVLREAGIVAMDKEGKHVRCSIAAGFRKRLSGKNRKLDLGCCTFSFEGD